MLKFKNNVIKKAKNTLISGFFQILFASDSVVFRCSRSFEAYIKKFNGGFPVESFVQN